MKSKNKKCKYLDNFFSRDKVMKGVKAKHSLMNLMTIFNDHDDVIKEKETEEENADDQDNGGHVVFIRVVDANDDNQDIADDDGYGRNKAE